MKRILLISIMLSLTINAYECQYLSDFKMAGNKYNIDYKLLCAIAKIESNYNPFALNINNADNYDIGILQINSWWFPKLKKVGMDDPRMLLDYQYNIDVGSWILKECINNFGISKKSIDCYNKGETKAQNKSAYIKKVEKAYKKIMGKYKNEK